MNKFKKLLILFILVSSFPGFTQVDTLSKNKKDEIIISISGGISVPMGEISSEVMQEYSGNVISGVPKIGFAGKIDAMYLFSKIRFGAKISFISSINKSCSESEGYRYRAPGTALGGGKSVYTYTYESKNWYFNWMMLGPIVEPIHSSKIFVQFWVTAGVLQAICPETQLVQDGAFWDISGRRDPFIETVTQPKMISRTFALNTGTDISFKLIRKMSVFLSVDFLTSDAIFKGTITDYYVGNPSYNLNNYDYSISMTKRIYMLECTLGIKYCIN